MNSKMRSKKTAKWGPKWDPKRVQNESKMTSPRELWRSPKESSGGVPRRPLEESRGELWRSLQETSGTVPIIGELWRNAQRIFFPEESWRSIQRNPKASKSLKDRIRLSHYLTVLGIRGLNNLDAENKDYVYCDVFFQLYLFIYSRSFDRIA